MSKNAQLANRNLVDWQANEQDKKKTDWVKLDTGETFCRNPFAVPESFTIDLSTYSGPVTCANPLGYAMSQATIYLENAPKMENAKEVELDVNRGAATTFTVTPSEGYTSMNEVDITLTNMPVYQDKTVCLCQINNVITPDAQYQGLSSVTANVNAKCVELQIPYPVAYPQTNCRKVDVTLTGCFACEMYTNVSQTDWMPTHWYVWESDECIQSAPNRPQDADFCYCCRFTIYTSMLPQDDGTLIGNHLHALLCVPAQFVCNCYAHNSGRYFELATLAGTLHQAHSTSATDKCHAVFYVEPGSSLFYCESNGGTSLAFHYTGRHHQLLLD